MVGGRHGVPVELCSDVFKKKLDHNIAYVLGDKTKEGPTTQQGMYDAAAEHHDQTEE